MLSFRKSATVLATALFLVVAQHASAFQCDLCFGPANEFNHVPEQNAKKTVETSMGTQNCEGFYLAALGGVLKNQDECRKMRNEFAHTCCNSDGGSGSIPAGSLFHGPASSSTPAPTPVPTPAPTPAPTPTSTNATGNSATTGGGNNQKMCNGAGYCCDLCSDPANQFDEVPQANHRKTVSTNLGTVNCLGFYNAAANGDVIQGQNQCFKIAQQFAPVCCNVHASRALRGSAGN